MSDWEIGDLALCVDDSLAEWCLHRGRIYRVRGVLGEMLVLDGIAALDGSGRDGMYASRFRKILPDKHEACEAEFVTLLRRTKRTVKA